MNTQHVVLITGASSGFGKLTAKMKVQSFMILAAIVSLLLMNGCGGKRPDNIGVVNNSLVACPASPNCVSSLEEEDAEHAIAPLTYTGTLADARTLGGDIPIESFSAQAGDFLSFDARFVRFWATNYYGLGAGLNEIFVFARIPEPGTAALATFGLMGLVAFGWRRKRRA